MPCIECGSRIWFINGPGLWISQTLTPCQDQMLYESKPACSSPPGSPSPRGPKRRMPRDTFAPAVVGSGSRFCLRIGTTGIHKLRGALAKRAHPRHDLTDAQWAKIAPIVSPACGPAVRQADVRGVVNAILWTQRTGMQGRALPSRTRYPPRTTCERNFFAWRLDGRCAKVCQVLARSKAVPPKDACTGSLSK